MEPWGPNTGKALALPSSFPPYREGYFTAQAWQAGFLDDEGFRRGSFMPPMFPMSSIQREIEKERIREEILWEMEERRILEEEVRRELEADRMMAMHDFHDRTMGKSYSSEFMIREGYGPNQWRAISEASFGGTRSGSHLPKKKLENLETGSANTSQFDKVLYSNEKLLGTKRKAEANTQASKVAKTVNKDLSCALCQITVTSEQSLNEHFKGKKHKSKVTALKGTIKIVNKTLGSNANPKPNPATVNMEKGKRNNTSKIINIQLNGKMYQVLKMKKHLWCEICKFKCNSTMAMVSHLEGKKHNAKLMEVEKNKKAVEIANPCCSVKVVEKVLVDESIPQASLEEEGMLEVASQRLPELGNTKLPTEKDDTVVVTEKEEHADVHADKAC